MVTWMTFWAWDSLRLALAAALLIWSNGFATYSFRYSKVPLVLQHMPWLWVLK